MPLNFIVVQVEEMSNQDVEIHALPYVLVLQSFCSVDPTLCAPASDPSLFAVTLQPYLKNQASLLLVFLIYVMYWTKSIYLFKGW